MFSRSRWRAPLLWSRSKSTMCDGRMHMLTTATPGKPSTSRRSTFSTSVPRVCSKYFTSRVNLSLDVSATASYTIVDFCCRYSAIVRNLATVVCCPREFLLSTLPLSDAATMVLLVINGTICMLTCCLSAEGSQMYLLEGSLDSGWPFLSLPFRDFVSRFRDQLKQEQKQQDHDFARLVLATSRVCSVFCDICTGGSRLDRASMRHRMSSKLTHSTGSASSTWATSEVGANFMARTLICKHTWPERMKPAKINNEIF